MGKGISMGDRMLWKYGTRYARLIKSIPLLKDLAEKKYRRLAGPGGAPTAGMREMLYLGDYRALTRTAFGHKMFVDTRDLQITPHVCLDGFWELHVARFLLATVKKGMNVVDIGSNIGCHTMLIADAVGEEGRIHCFEANPHIFEILRQNVMINGFLERAILCNKAVSQDSGRREFHVSKRFHGVGTLGKIDHEVSSLCADEETTIEVETTSLDDYFSGEAVRIDVIKMDVQGSEPLVFRGMKRILRDNPGIKIICEFEPFSISAMGEDPNRFITEISNNGFRMHVILPDSGIKPVSPSDLLSVRNCELFLSRG